MHSLDDIELAFIAVITIDIRLVENFKPVAAQLP